MNELAEQNSQRLGQFIFNAVSDHLKSLDKENGEFEVANALFFMSDEQLNTVLTTYGRVLDARKPSGFSK